jgi:hypothetical protein
VSTFRYVSAGGAMLLSAAVASLFTDALSNRPASAEDVAVHAGAAPPEAPAPVAPTRKVRIIDMSAENAASSDQSKWHNRARKPPVQKIAAKAEVARSESRTAERPKKKVVRRASPPPQDARAAYAAEPAPRRGGFALFDW